MRKKEQQYRGCYIVQSKRGWIVLSAFRKELSVHSSAEDAKAAIDRSYREAAKTAVDASEYGCPI
jgi:hypothetical protein